jgi:hypothetical protein
MRVTIQPDFQQLLTAYTSSNVLRIGAAYLDGELWHKAELAATLQLSFGTLRKYARRVEQYFYTKPRQKVEWHYSEDNFVMGNYQFKRLPYICEGLPNRTRNAIIKRAIFLGVAKERKAFTN